MTVEWRPASFGWEYQLSIPLPCRFLRNFAPFTLAADILIRKNQIIPIDRTRSPVEAKPCRNLGRCPDAVVGRLQQPSRSLDQGGITILVLTRQVGEGIVITGDIQVTVLAITGGRVRLGIAAPESVRVDRREVYVRQADGAVGPGQPAVGPARWPEPTNPD